MFLDFDLGKFRQSRTLILITVSLALFTDLLIYGVVIPLLPDLLKKFPNHEKDAYLLLPAYALGLFIATPIFGFLSDRFNNRKIPMLFGLISLSIVTCIFPLAESFNVLVFCRICQGVAASATWIVGLALIADVYLLDELGYALGIVMSFNSAGLLLGPLIGGVLGLISLEFPFYFCSVFTLFVACFRLLAKPTKVSPFSLVASESNDPSGTDQIVEPPNLRSILKSNKIRLLCVQTILAASSISAVEGTLATRLETDYKFNIFQTSLVTTCYILPSILSSIASGYYSDIYSKHLIMSIGTLVHSLTPWLLAISPNINFIVLNCIIFGFTSSIMSTPITAEFGSIMKSMGSTKFALVYAIFNFCYGVGMTLGPWLVGYGLLVIGNWAFAILSLILLGFAPIFYSRYN